MRIDPDDLQKQFDSVPFPPIDVEKRNDRFHCYDYVCLRGALALFVLSSSRITQLRTVIAQV